MTGRYHFILKSAWERTVVLAHLLRQAEGCTMQSIGAALYIDHTTLWQQLVTLEELGLVSRVEIHDHDIAGATVPRHGRFLWSASRGATMILPKEPAHAAAV